jgi:hypothetical protein
VGFVLPSNAWKIKQVFDVVRLNPNNPLALFPDLERNYIRLDGV